MTATVVPLVQEQTKTCTKCGETKPISAFHKNRALRGGGYTYGCAVCLNIEKKIYHAKNKDITNTRRRKKYKESPEYRKKISDAYKKARNNKDYRVRESLRDRARRYDASVPEIEAMINAQSGLCANKACASRLILDPWEREGRKDMSGTPHVDHDHKTGVVRGILCGPCNLTLGNARDSIAILLGLAEYLRRVS